MTAGLPEMLPDIFTNLPFSRTGSGSKNGVKLTTSPPIIVSTLFVLLAFLFFFGGTSGAASSSLKAVSGFAEATGLPGELGKIVYQKNPESNIQLFIIGNSHRSSASGENGSDTVPAQVQTYRIAEWLISQHQVELLLPEGFFGRQERTGIPDAIIRHDDPTLEEALTDTSTFINADLLLHRNYGMTLHQVEDRDLYRHVREFLHSGLKSGERLLAPFGLELEYLQERRSAAILQKIPAVINAEYRQGHIAQPRAILTIGMAHLDEMIKFLEAERIEVLAPPIGASGFQDYREVLNLVAQEVGVTVIVPRVMLADRERMFLANLQP
jgi:hypothetical protein